MSDWSIVRFLIGGTLGLLASVVSGPSAVAQTAAVPPVSDGPVRLLVERDGAWVTVRGLYVGPQSGPIDLTYEMTIDRTGASTSRTRQGGAVRPASVHPDTLSTTRINVQPGDHLSLRLVLREGSRVVDTIRRDEVISPAE